MENIYSIENFEEGNTFREINSPRTLEACLRSGLVPEELYPRSKNEFREKGLTKDMLELKYEAFERKRQDKILSVQNERANLIRFSERKKKLLASGEQPEIPQNTRVSTLAEIEEKRLEALRRRQEKELAKMIQREQQQIHFQEKIQHTEEEELKKKRAHEKKVADQKAKDEKKQAERMAELRRKEQEEAEHNRQLARKEQETENKLKQERLAEEQRLLKEARLREMERQEKMRQYQRRVEETIENQIHKAEELKMMMTQRDETIKEQFLLKKQQKEEEANIQRQKASQRITEALSKTQQTLIDKKLAFDERQKEAMMRAKEISMKEKEELKKHMESREKKNNARLTRMIEAWRARQNDKENTLKKIQEKDMKSESARKEMNEHLLMQKFNSQLKLEDKIENVERVSRVTHFQRLQTMKRLEEEENKYFDLQVEREEKARKHKEEMKQNLIQRHDITNAMEVMRVTNDFSLLDKLFTKKKKENRKLARTGGGGGGGGGGSGGGHEEEGGGGLGGGEGEARAIHTA